MAEAITQGFYISLSYCFLSECTYWIEIYPLLVTFKNQFLLTLNFSEENNGKGLPEDAKTNGSKGDERPLEAFLY